MRLLHLQSLECCRVQYVLLHLLRHPYLSLRRCPLWSWHSRQREWREWWLLPLSQILLVRSLMQLMVLLHGILVYLLSTAWCLASHAAWRLGPRIGARFSSDNEVYHVLPLLRVPSRIQCILYTLSIIIQ